MTVEEEKKEGIKTEVYPGILIKRVQASLLYCLNCFKVTVFPRIIEVPRLIASLEKPPPFDGNI